MGMTLHVEQTRERLAGQTRSKTAPSRIQTGLQSGQSLQSVVFVVWRVGDTERRHFVQSGQSLQSAVFVVRAGL